MRDTVWNGQPQTLTLPDGRPKGAALVLQERGYDTTRMKLEEMRRILAEHDDFKNEKCRVDIVHPDINVQNLSTAITFLPYILKIHNKQHSVASLIRDN